MSTVSGAALIGRADELERLRECARGISQGAGTLVLVDGEAGAGKTRLLSEVMKAPFLPRGYTAVSAGALDYARAPYAPIRDLLAGLDKRFPKVLSANVALAGALRPVMELAPVGSGAAEGGGQRRILDAVVEALEKYAAASPVMLAIEDVHWIDRASADVLLHLSRRIATLRALILVSFRPAEAEQDEEIRNLVAQLSRSAAVSFSLKPLELSDALLLVDDVATRDLSMDVRRRICQMADGNPLLLVEYTKLASQSAEALHGALPVTLKGLIADRLAGFDSIDVDILRVAAEMGQFELLLLADIAGVSADRVLATLKKARKASIVEERKDRSGFMFRHALIRRAIADELLSVERTMLNRRIAERLEQEGSAPSLHSRLAHHYAAADDAEKARRYSELAADEAMSVYAFADAALLFERAIDGRELSAETLELYSRLADAYTLAHRAGDALKTTERLFEYALQCGDGAAIGHWGFELSRRRYSLLDDLQAIEAVKRALEHVDSVQHPAVAFNLHATHAWYLGSLRKVEEGVEALRPATALFEHGDDEMRIRYHEAQSYIHVHGGTIEGFREHSEAALKLAERIGGAIYLRRLENVVGLALASNLDDMDFALDICARFERAAAATPQSIAAPYSALMAWPLYLSGQLVRARAILTASFAITEDAPLIGFLVARTGIPLALHLDDQLLLRRCARPRLLQSAFASKVPNVFGPVAAAVAAQLRSEKRPDEAAALLEQTIKRLENAANNLPLMIEAARINASAILPRVFELLEDLSKGSRSARAALHLCKAYVSRGHVRTEEALAAARAFNDVRWRLYEAEALELAGERAGALELYRSCGSVAGVRRLEARSAVQSQSPLSKREWEVAALVAEGKSNRSIADALVLSERTVENHISSIFTKLNLRSRAEVAAFFARTGAADT
jgi:DNA-binding CsgD family transcriptional regulator